MSERTRNLLMSLAMVSMALVLASLVLSSPTDEDRVGQLGASIRCPVCQGEAIIDSPAEMARDMMSLIAERVEAGFTDEEIVEELLGSFSGAVLLDPPVSGSTLPLWLAPAVAMAAGIGLVWWWQRHPGNDPAEPDRPAPRSKRRMLAGGLLLAGAAAGVVAVAGASLQDRDGPVSGVVADLGGQDLAQVSNDTLEAVITAYTDHPEIDGMRLALGERYFTAGDYRAAFPHYLAVAESEVADPTQVSAALIALGWMAWDGNGEGDTAIGLFDRALEVDPDSVTARYLKGRVLWCLGDPDGQAASIFADILDGSDVPEESRAQIAADLAAVQEGEQCR